MNSCAGTSGGRPGRYIVAALLTAVLSLVQTASAQEPAPPIAAAATLPDAPDALHRAQRTIISGAQAISPARAPNNGLGSGSVGDFLNGTREAIVDPTRLAPTYHLYILPDEQAPQLSPRQRLFFGFHQPITPYFLFKVGATAGYEQAVNGNPNYGSNLTAYGQRLGAAAVRSVSQSVFTESLMAPLLHEDPRYFVIGNRQNPAVRAAYAISRVFVTRRDEGGLTPNYALFAGLAATDALNNAFYPAPNVGLRQTGRSFVGSLIGAGLSNLFCEFLPDGLRATHLERFE